MDTAPATPVPDQIAAGLAGIGIDLSPDATASALAGGVSSDIWHVRDRPREWCVKRALPTLRTAARWDAPVERSASEAAWLAAAVEIDPESVPRVVGYDHGTYTLVLEYLRPAAFRNWKDELLAGRTDAAVASRLGRSLGRWHSAMSSAGHRARFDHADLIHALRLEPYVERTLARHPDLDPQLGGLTERFHEAARTVVHGDVSPKNVLVGDGRVILLDAECATWGDPSFDVAFCLTHLCAKAVHLPAQAAELRSAADDFVAGYTSASAAEWTDGVPHWLPALLLARVDGASPLEYLDDPARRTIRDSARSMIQHPSDGCPQTITDWFELLASHGNATIPHPAV